MTGELKVNREKGKGKSEEMRCAPREVIKSQRTPPPVVKLASTRSTIAGFAGKMAVAHEVRQRW